MSKWEFDSDIDMLPPWIQNWVIVKKGVFQVGRKTGMFLAL